MCRMRFFFNCQGHPPTTKQREITPRPERRAIDRFVANFNVGRKTPNAAPKKLLETHGKSVEAGRAAAVRNSNHSTARQICYIAPRGTGGPPDSRTLWSRTDRKAAVARPASRMAQPRKCSSRAVKLSCLFRGVLNLGLSARPFKPSVVCRLI